MLCGQQIFENGLQQADSSVAQPRIHTARALATDRQPPTSPPATNEPASHRHRQRPHSPLCTDNAINDGGSADADLVLSGLLPIYAFTNALQILAAATGDANGANGVRLTLSNIGTGIFRPVANAMWMLLFDAVIYTLLFIYCDMVLPIGPGVKFHPLFFLQRSFWRGEGAVMDAKGMAKPPEPGEKADVIA